MFFKRNMLKTGKKGFTLIELLAVIAIIGVLASVVLASLNGARRKSRDARRLSDIKQIQNALELYFDGNTANPNEYPDATSALSGATACSGAPCISGVPADPNGVVYSYSNVTNAGAACSVATGVCTSYVLRALLEDDNPALDNDVDGTVDSITCATEATPTFEYCVRP